MTREKYHQGAEIVNRIQDLEEAKNLPAMYLLKRCEDENATLEIKQAFETFREKVKEVYDKKIKELETELASI